MPAISYLARQAVLTRLADPTLGYATSLAEILPNYPNVLDASVLEILNFTLDNTPNSTTTSPNVLSGDVAADRIDGSTAFKYPTLAVYSLRGDNVDSPIGAIFGGPVIIGMKLYLSWNPADVLPDFDSYADCAEDAIYSSINATDPPLITANGSYAGKMSFQRSQIIWAAENWRQVIQFSIPFRMQFCS